MIKIGQKYKIVNHSINILNGIIVKVIEYNEINKTDFSYLLEIVDKSLLDDPEIKKYFHNENIWISENYLQPLRSHKLKKLLK